MTHTEALEKIREQTNFWFVAIRLDPEVLKLAESRLRLAEALADISDGARWCMSWDRLKEKAERALIEAAGGRNG